MDELYDEEDCNVCGAPIDMECHPNCPNGKMRNDMPNFFEYLNDIIVKSADEFFTRQQKQVEKKILTERMEDFMQDWKEMATFCEALVEAEHFTEVKDVIDFLQNPAKFSRQYLLWLELERPMKKDKAEFNLFKLELINRRSSGKQAKETGNDV